MGSLVQKPASGSSGARLSLRELLQWKQDPEVGSGVEVEVGEIVLVYPAVDLPAPVPVVAFLQDRSPPLWQGPLYKGV